MERQRVRAQANEQQGFRVIVSRPTSGSQGNRLKAGKLKFIFVKAKQVRHDRDDCNRET